MNNENNKMQLNKLANVDLRLTQGQGQGNSTTNLNQVLKQINNADGSESEFDLNSLEVFIGKSELKIKNIAKCLIDKYQLKENAIFK